MENMKKWLEFFKFGVEIAADKDYLPDHLFSSGNHPIAIGYSTKTDEEIEKAWADFDKMKNLIFDTKGSDTIIIKIKESDEGGKANIKIASTSGLDHESEAIGSEEINESVLIALASAFGYEPAELFNFEGAEIFTFDPYN
jgi:hypothetical protein